MLQEAYHANEVFLMLHVHTCMCIIIILCLFAVTSGEREMTIVDCAMKSDAVKWNERVLLLQTLGLLK